MDIRSSRFGSLNVLFAGGCHVSGYPVGQDGAFSSTFAREMAVRGKQARIHRLSHIKLTHEVKLVSKCKEVCPELLVLQLGHFELVRDLTSYIRSFAGLPSAYVSSVSSRAVTPPVKHSSIFFMKAAVKAAVDHMLGRRLVDFDRFEEQLDRFLGAVGKCAIPQTILLSPLPCADRMLMYYRHRALEIFRSCASRHRVDFLDLLELAPTACQAFGHAEFYYDGGHLGELGHRWLGTEIARRYEDVFKSRLSRVTSCTQ